MTNSTELKKDIQVDMDISLAINPNDPEEKWKRDFVCKIIDKMDYNPDGIEVETCKGYIGNIKEIYEKNSIDKVKERISKGENNGVEFKETYNFDIKNNIKNNERTFDILKAVNAFLNAEGGYLYIGVNDSGTCIGLERDYSIMKENNGNKDTLELKIRSLLKSSLTNESEVHESTKQINFHTIDNVEICEMFIKASNVPIFIKSKIVTIKENNEQIKIDKMYKRTGNASTIITTFEDFLEYYKTHFIKPSSF